MSLENAKRLIDSGDYVVAASLIDDYLKTHLNSAEAWFLRARCLIAQSKHTQAIVELKKAASRALESTDMELAEQVLLLAQDCQRITGEPSSKGLVHFVTGGNPDRALESWIDIAEKYDSHIQKAERKSIKASVKTLMSELKSTGIRFRPDVESEILEYLIVRKEAGSTITAADIMDAAIDQYLLFQFQRFDFEQFDYAGLYSPIAKDIAKLAGTALPLRAINSTLTMDEKFAVLQFKLNDKHYEWLFQIRSDHNLNPDVFHRFAELLVDLKHEKRFVYWDSKSIHAFCLGCMTMAQFTKIRNVCGQQLKLLHP
jgi:tetratricopeptide (TPR) repeat protein